MATIFHFAVFPLVVLSLGVSCQILTGEAPADVAAKCPCADASLCDPIRTVAKREILAYSRNRPDWRHYFWDNITTVAVQDGFDPQIMCHAHSKGVRVVVWGTFSEAVLFNETAREAWIAQTVQAAIGNFTDGYNIDYENPLQKSKAPVLTEMVKQIRDAFRKALPYSQITFATPWSPACMYDRCFDYRSIAELLDYLMLMDYDELVGDGRAMANAPLNKTQAGIEEYLRIGVPASKIVLGVPWYGYDFTCNNSVDPMTHVCTYKETRQVEFGDIMKLLAYNSTTGRLWSEEDQSPYFNYKDIGAGQIHQVWYDDWISLELRYNLARSLNVFGWAAFHADCLDYSTNKRAVNETNEMWDGLIGY